jgi:glycosyltransferase involved in cell wall biosynthesis
LIQAAARGVPVISTEATGCVDAVSNGFNGILVKPKSVVELKQAMELLFNDGNLRDQYGKNGIIWAKNFDRNIIWNELNNIYQS